MENNVNISSVKKDLHSSALSENLKIAQIFDLCLQPTTKENLDNILLDFQERIKDIQLSEYFCIFDFASMYVLDYVYKHDTASFCSVSRTLYFYQMLGQLVLKGENRNRICSCDNGCLVKTLQEFSSVYTYSKSLEMLVDVGLSAILTGNLGLVRYLVKFGLIEFPSEVNEKCKKMFEILVNMFNSCYKPSVINVQADNIQSPIELADLLNKVKKEKEINIKRAILTFCTLTIVAEYKMYEKIEAYLGDLKFYTELKKDLCLRKLMCIHAYIEATLESTLTFKDIENFTEVFLNSFLTAEVGKSLVETSRKMLGEKYNYYNPRTLKKLARLKVRSIFGNSISIPEQVIQLEIPFALKEFLNFHSKGIWEFLVINHLNLSFEQKLNRLEPETEDRNDQAIEDLNVPEFQDRNEQALENEIVREPEDRNEQARENEIVREPEDRNEQGVENGNELELENRNEQVIENETVQELEDRNEQAIENGNVPELEDGNEQAIGNENVQELDERNEQAIENGNVRELED